MPTDLHAHWLPRDLLEACVRGRTWQGMEMSRNAAGFPAASAAGRSSELAQSAFHFEGLDRRAEVVRGLGISRQVISPMPRLYRYEASAARALVDCREINDALALELAERRDGTFLGLGILPLQDVPSAVAELERAVVDLSLAGVALGTSVDGSRWDDTALWPVLEVAESLKAVLLMHPAETTGYPVSSRYYLRNVFANPADTTVALLHLILSGALDRFPDLRLVAVHGGGYVAQAAARLEHAWSVRPEMSVDLKSSPTESVRRIHVDNVVFSASALRLLIDVHGHDRVVMGTDFPADMSEPDPVRLVHAACPDPVEAAAVLDVNADRLLGR